MEQTPPSLSLNDETDYGLCFACGPRNPSGLRLRFERRGDSVTTTFRGGEAHQGFPGYVHGGIISAVLDEVMSRVSLLDNRWTMTARMDVRYRRPVLVDQSITAVADKGRVMRRFVEVSGRVHLPDGAIAAEATGTFAFLDREDLTRIASGYPGLAEEWMLSS